jgi:hypothetical protein
LLRDVHSSRDVDEWARAVVVAFEAVDDARHRLPPPWRHLKRSVRAAEGEAVGVVAFGDFRSSGEQDALAEYNHRWTEYAMEYTDLVLDAVRRWRDARPKTAEKIALLSFYAWLARTGRHPTADEAHPVRRRRTIRWRSSLT